MTTCKYTGQCANQNDNTYTANDSIHPPLALVVVAATVHPRKTLLLTATEIIMFHIEDIASLVYSTSCSTTPQATDGRGHKVVSSSLCETPIETMMSHGLLSLLPRRGSIPLYSNIITMGLTFEPFLVCLSSIGYKRISLRWR